MRSLVARLRIVNRELREAERKLDELCTAVSEIEQTSGEGLQRRDVAILRSMPGIAGSISAHCSPRPLGPSAAVTTKASGRCPVRRRLPSAAASHLLLSGAMLRTSDCATRSITGHVSPPSAIPSVASDILRCANVATRTDVLSVVSRTDCLPWHVSFSSDRRCLTRNLADLPHNGGTFKARQNLVWLRWGFFVRLSARFSRSLIVAIWQILSTALCSTRRRRGRHRWDALRPDKHPAVMARRSGQGMKPLAARACARPLTAPSTMTLLWAA
jgi:hypothetical protein